MFGQEAGLVGVGAQENAESGKQRRNEGDVGVEVEYSGLAIVAGFENEVEGSQVEARLMGGKKAVREHSAIE